MRRLTGNETSYARSLQTAVDKGRAAADIKGLTEADNPYTRYEQRTSWRYGFQARRKELAAPPMMQMRLPYKDD